jgi:UPF0271 protein
MEPRGRPLVLDTSALLTGKPLPVTGREVVAPEGVREEVARGGPEGRALDYLEGAGLRYAAPTAAARARVAAAAKESGDAMRVSRVDVDVLALALDVSGEILSDDYSIQNLARKLGIPYVAVGARGITAELKWAYRCVGCRREFPEPRAECPVCGSAVKAGRPRRA